MPRNSSFEDSKWFPVSNGWRKKERVKYCGIAQAGSELALPFCPPHSERNLLESAYPGKISKLAFDFDIPRTRIITLNLFDNCE
jgi:hypothetical protein